MKRWLSELLEVVVVKPVMNRIAEAEKNQHVKSQAAQSDTRDLKTEMAALRLEVVGLKETVAVLTDEVRGLKPPAKAAPSAKKKAADASEPETNLAPAT